MTGERPKEAAVKLTPSKARKMTMSTNTKESNVEVELRPLELHELEIVSGGLPSFMQAGPQMEGAYLTVCYGIG